MNIKFSDRKKLIMVVVAVVLVLLVMLGVGGYFLAANTNIFGGNGDRETEQLEVGDSNTDSSEVGEEFFGYLTSGESVECNWTSSLENQNIEGVIYTDDGRFRQEFYSSEIESNNFSIYKDEKVYTWTEAEDEGLLIDVGPLEDLREQFFADDGAGSVGGLDDSFTLECNPWETDPDKFLVPDNVSFISLEELQRRQQEQLQQQQLQQ